MVGPLKMTTCSSRQDRRERVASSRVSPFMRRRSLCSWGAPVCILWVCRCRSRCRYRTRPWCFSRGKSSCCRGGGPIALQYVGRAVSTVGRPVVSCGRILSTHTGGRGCVCDGVCRRWSCGVCSSRRWNTDCSCRRVRLESVAKTAWGQFRTRMCCGPFLLRMCALAEFLHLAWGYCIGPPTEIILSLLLLRSSH
ncbi:hypothetical protein B0H13DRAFT_507675 [Mycena leptocephala]|nr:hypothetical protein B0H13DRAFT_507675 [Mycena leptocephala]